MRIYIPTVGRVGRQLTADALRDAGADYQLVVPAAEARLHKKHPVLVAPAEACSEITKKRQWILDNAAAPKFAMFDDDLKFKVRREDGTQFDYADSDAISKMLYSIESQLDRVAHVGLTDDFMAHTRLRGFIRVGRYNQVLAYNTSLFSKGDWPRFRVYGSEEHDFHLQLLARGLQPVILTEYTKASKNYAAGGISTFKPRSAEDEMRAHREIAEKWPDFVKIVPNERSISGYSVQIKWAEANKVLVNRGRLM